MDRTFFPLHQYFPKINEIKEFSRFLPFIHRLVGR